MSLILGDNLTVLRGEPSEKYGLVYLDPPFNSDRTYHLGQETAFQDTWRWGAEAEAALRSLGPLSGLLSAMKAIWGPSAMAYAVMMAERLIEMHRVLKSDGTLYLHCDPSASHYLRMVLDGVFGCENFRGEVIWKRSASHSDGKQGARGFGRVHDTILVYSKSPKWVWNPLYTEYSPHYINSDYRHVEPGTGRRYRLGDLTGPGGAGKGNPSYPVMGIVRHWRYSEVRMAELIAQGRVIQTRPGTVPQFKRYLDEMPGVPLQDVWIDIDPLHSRAKDRTGYPTQKPVALLERIIQVSSNEGDLVLDPFCGSGTTLVAAQRNRRRWVGIDVSETALSIARQRLDEEEIDGVALIEQMTQEGDDGG